MFPRVTAVLCAALIAAQSSLVFDFVSRQKISDAHMKLMNWKQLPVPVPDSMKLHTPFLTPRVLELVYTAYDMASLARDLGDPVDAVPFQWDEERRAQICAELDAYFFLLYGVSREDADYILETFQTEKGGLKNNEIAKYGTYRTKDLVLAEYDRMAASGVSLAVPLIDGENYTSTLTPPPGHGSRHPKQSTTTTFRGRESASVIGEAPEAVPHIEVSEEPPAPDVCPGTGQKGRLEFRDGWEDWYVHCPTCGMTWTGGSDVIDPHKPLR